MQVVLITGTSKGLGYELANLYLRSGFFVIGISRKKPAIHADNYHHFTADVTHKDMASGLIAFLELLGVKGIDIVINNAGTGSYGYTLPDVDPDEVLRQVDLHCVGVLRVVRAIRPYLDKSKIVNVTSRLGSVALSQRGDFAAREFSYSYRIAKCAQNMLSLCLSDDPELSNVTIMSVNPGLLRTDSGSSDARYSAYEGALALISVVSEANENGFYHAFGEEAFY